MKHLISAALCAISLAASLAQAEDGREYLGRASLLTNDVIGDTEDRWRTGSYMTSLVWGPEWQGRLPDMPGQVLELRFHGEVLAPENLSNPAPGDRPWAGALSLGLHTHFRVQQIDMSLGADLVVTGPQTGLDDFQDNLHDYLGGGDQSGAMLAAQIDDDVHPTLVFEAGRDLALSDTARLRPFVEGRLGIETLARVGFDATFGQVGQNGLMLRDPTTGHRSRVVADPAQGFSFVVGADIAYVEDSEFLPENRALDLTEARGRVRAGLHWENRKGSSLFYGVTWLSEEFDAQPEGQVVGSMRLKLKF